MRFYGPITAALVMVVCVCSYGQAKPAMPDEIVIGRHTFIDVGPPNDYYEVIQLRTEGVSVSARRIFLTPYSGCFQPAKVESAEAILKMSMADLLGGVDPCRISSKETKKELRRRKKYMVFSGEDISLQLECNGSPRVLSSAILDRDLFDKDPQTPQVTSWTMRLLGKVDQGLGPGAWDKPMFPLGQKETKAPPPHPLIVLEAEVRDGKYDGLFGKDADRISKIYADSLRPSATPTALLLSSSSEPDSYIAPLYPPIAKLARVEGDVSFRSTVGEACRPEIVEIIGGPAMLRQTTIDAVKQWKFCSLPKGAPIKGTIRFQLNCPVTVKTSVSQR